MDWQKNILIAGILAVLLMLVIRWHHFQEVNLAAAEITKTTQVSTKTSINDEAMHEIPNAQTIPSTTSSENLALTEIIKVKTDNLVVEINPLGGDIVKVSLPKHSDQLATPDVPFVLLNNDENHTYIAQSGLIGKNGTDSAQGKRPFYNTTQIDYELAEDQQELYVDLVLQQNNTTITKRFTFKRNQYLIEIEYIIDNKSDENWTAQLYGQIKRDEKSFTKTSALQMNPFLGAAVTTNDENYKKFTFASLEEKKFEFSKQGGWVAMVQHYFISAWIPDSTSENNYYLRKIKNTNLYIFGFTSKPFDIAAGTTGSVKTNFYAGPKDTESLEKISPYLDLTVDYGWLWWVAKPLFWLLKFIHNLVGNWGLAIIGLTIVVKAAFFKLSATSYKSMAKMRKLAPKMAEMKERFGDDRQKMSQEMMKLYKTEQVNPFGGCLPLLIQMPVFLALYWVLMESVELRHAPFFLWIKDLSVLDPYFVLPIIYGISMWFMQKLNPQPTDPMQAKIMQMLPLVFTFMFLWFPAGLVLYWVTNNTLSIIQQYIITKQIENTN